MVVERSEPNFSHPHGEAPPARAASLEWRMGSLVLDPVARILIHDGNPLPLGERAVSILLMLVERSGQLVSKEDLIAFAWQGLAVEDSNLTVQVAALRRALALIPGGSSWIETLPRRGYRFAVPPYDPGRKIRRRRMNHGQPDRLMKWRSYPRPNPWTIKKICRSCRRSPIHARTTWLDALPRSTCWTGWHSAC